MFRHINELSINISKFDSINSISWSRVLSAGCTSEMCTRLSRFTEPRLSLAVQVMGLCRQRGHWRGWFIDDHQINSNPFNNYNKLQTDKWTGREDRKDMVLLCSVVFYESGTTLVPQAIWRIDVHARLYCTITGDRYLWDYYISSPHS